MAGGLVLVLVASALAWWIAEGRRRRRYPVPEGHRPEVSLPHGQAFELYHNALSLCSMKTRVCMAELRVPYKGHAIDLIETGRYENIGRDFLRVNPAGTVPVLVHRGHPIYESHEQIRYAAEHAPAQLPSTCTRHLHPLSETFGSRLRIVLCVSCCVFAVLPEQLVQGVKPAAGALGL